MMSNQWEMWCDWESRVLRTQECCFLAILKLSSIILRWEILTKRPTSFRVLCEMKIATMSELLYTSCSRQY